jgi:PEGA domain
VRRLRPQLHCSTLYCSVLLLLLPLLLLPLLPSCASRSLTIETKPAGADVYVDGEYVGKSPVKVPFVYGGEREILVYPPSNPSETKGFWHPRRIIYDTTRDAFDLPVIDLASEIAGSEDKQKVTVDLKESRLVQNFDADHDAWCAAVRARANTLRSRAREFQLGALPSERGRDPGPLDSRPASRTAAAPVANPPPR